ncbi:MAG: chemotaxis-specific protein-glutamate methyltransferase CheB [Chitinispirillaceae bacterium]|nr:chemotaxis-specific protein-glutamate methyltransferase CheB [Chitinispirillaceae bacterium]
MPITTLIVDDTITYRKILSDAAATFPELQVSGTAPSGSLALRKMEQQPVQLVLLDIHMPDMDGVETLRRIKASHPDTFVVMVSGISSRGAETTIQALQLGAIDFIRKPDGANPEINFQQLISDLKPVVRLITLRTQLQSGMATAPAAPAGTSRTTAPMPTPVSRPPAPLIRTGSVPNRFSVVAIGVSTGGPEALTKLLPLLPGNLPVPVVLVQHMPPLFTKSLADSLGKKSPLKIIEAAEGDVVTAGTVYIAPGGRHMVVRKEENTVVIRLNDGPPENSCRPAVDVLFRSVAATYGDSGILSVILTGMGSDGCAGVRACKRSGCFSITQSEPTCVVYGMPRAVDEAGLSDLSLPLEKIAETIVARTKR